MVYDNKHDGCHKSRLVAGSHLTDPNTENAYSGIVSLQGIRLITFLSQLNELGIWGTDDPAVPTKEKHKFLVFLSLVTILDRNW
jgi:hypothetical protein